MLSKPLGILWVVGLACLVGEVCRAGVVQWDFEGDLSPTTAGGSALVAGFAAPETIPRVTFTDATINGGNAHVAEFSRGTLFVLHHGLAPNGGGARVNQYTLIIDVLFNDRSPSGGWAALWQTTDVNNNDADWAVNPQGALGISGRYGGLVSDGLWARVTLVVDNVNHILKSFIDGVEVSHVVGSQVSVDGRFSLDATALLFADDTEENSAGVVNSVQIRDYPLTPEEVAALGPASSGGIPIPDFTCPRSFTCAADKATKKITLSWIPGQDATGLGYEIFRDGTEIGTAPLNGGTFTDTVPGPGFYLYELKMDSGVPAECPQLPLKCRVYLAQPDQFLFEDFEGYRDDGELVGQGGWLPIDENEPFEDATWTVTNPGGRLNPPTENGSPSTGNFLISDSDKACCDDTGGSGMSHDLWSPPFSCAGASVVWLHFDCSAQMNNNGQCVFDVDVSTNNGNDWTNVFRRIAPSRTIPPAVTTSNSDGFFGRLHLDLSAQAANQPLVRVRFRHFEPNDDWWIAIDDLLVDSRPHRGGEVFLRGPDRFSNGIPAEYTVLSNAIPANAGAETWTTIDACNRSIFANQGKFPYLDGRGIHRLDEHFAIIDDDCDPDTPKDEYLITEPLDLSQATEVFLHFKSEIVADNVAVQEVLLSLDGGDTYEPDPLFSYNPLALFDSGEDTFYAERILAAPEAIRQPNVAFAFHYSSPGGRFYWAIDDVRVSADGANLPRRTCPNRDFRVERFDSSTGSVTCRWNPIAGDQGFRVLANGSVISGNLPGTAQTYTDASPPAGGSVTYSLQTLSGGQVEFECAAPPISVFACPRDLLCCVNQQASTVNLSWLNGLNLAGTGYRITRNGVPIRTVPLTATSYEDSSVPGPGTYNYQLILNGGDPAQCPGLPLKCTVTVIGGEVIFSDGFDCYRNDADLKAAGWEIHEENGAQENAFWTVTNPGGRDNPPRADGTPSEGAFIISDSDAACCEDVPGSGMSHDIWSPSFNCTQKSKVWLHLGCSAILNNNGLAIFDVDVTNDGGRTWTNLLRRIAPARGVDPLPLAEIPDGFGGGPQVGNADGFFGPLDLDLSGQAAGKPDVRFRLRQFEPNDDWWIAVDDVVVDSTPALGGDKVLLPKEEFSNGIPPDWALQSLNDLSPWRATDPCLVSVLNFNGGTMPDGFDGRRIHHLDATFALVSTDEACIPQIQDELMITPALDATGVKQVFLHFKSAIFPTGAVAEVLLSLDGGDSFDSASPLFSYHRGGLLLRDLDNGESIYNEYVLEVPAAVGQKNFAIGFHYLNSSAVPSYWAVDDVQVTADTGGGALAGFIRGDCNHDGSTDISDVVFNLAYQFLGGPAPDCLEACNANADDGNDITDAVYFLSYQFLGGPAPPAPGAAACGKDPVAGPLSCEKPSC
jgi:hypothetical protein